MWEWLRNQWRELRRPAASTDATTAAVARARLELAQTEARALTDQVAKLESAIGIAQSESDAAFEQEAALREPLRMLRLELAELKNGRSRGGGFGNLYQQQRELLENDTAALVRMFEERVAELRALAAQHQSTLETARETATTAVASARRAQALFESQSRRYRELQALGSPEGADPLAAFIREEDPERER